jgi:DNA-binding response OmpR family regulator
MAKIKKLLSIEDNDDHFEIMSYYLETIDNSLEISRFNNGELAIQAKDELSQSPPDLILLDVNLPKFSGLEVLEQYKSTTNLKNVPIVIYSTSNSEKDMAAAYDKGANSYFMKSMDVEGTKHSLEAILNYWSLNEQKPNLNE